MSNRNYVAKHSRNMAGAGEHQNRKYKASKGQLRKAKHKRGEW